ncbi:hypothetical protein MKW98_001951, partial [Papaver atlanticum]
MAQIHRLHVQNELKNCSADQLYSFFKNERTKLPQVLPHIFKSVQILAGDGNSAGTVKLGTTSYRLNPEQANLSGEQAKETQIKPKQLG